MSRRKPKQSGHNPATVCPYKGEPGYLRGRIVRDPQRPGWLVLYDRERGAVPGMDKIVWNEHTRWVVMWRPLPGRNGKVLFRALGSEALADDALKWAAKGFDQLRLWDGREVRSPTAGPEKEGAARACAHDACAQEPVAEACAPAREPKGESETAPAPNQDRQGRPLVPRPDAGAVARIRAAHSREAQADDVLLHLLPIDVAMGVLTDIAQNARKAFVTNGELIDDVEDNPTRLKALELYTKLLLLHAAQREKEQVVEVLDDSHLYRNFFLSAALREEITRMLEEFQRDGVVTTKIPGDLMVA